MRLSPSTTTQAFLVGGLGIGLYSVMDALMKGLSMSLGAYNAALWRGLFGIVFLRPSAQAIRFAEAAA